MRHKLFIAVLAASVAGAAACQTVLPHWSDAQASRLIDWLASADGEGLGSVTPLARNVEAVRRTGDGTALDVAATAAALRLLDALRHGCCNASLRSGWNIAEEKGWLPPNDAVAAAVQQNRLEDLLAQARPSHPFYQGLRAAYAGEKDPARRATLAANLDRWRWMPRTLGRRYLLVNTAAFEASLWDDRRLLGRWKVVVGKTKSPTPVFAAQVTGVVLNPWWEIPPNIAAESVAAMVQDHPAQAASKGYTLEKGRYRQRPGPDNALGRMKLVMPNGYHVYLHDTPSQGLFERDVRAYSHGCVRVGDALGLVTALLSTRPGWDRNHVEAAVATTRTQTVPLAAPIPVYVTYFTAEPDGEGGVRYFPDIYKRDSGAKAPADDGRCTR
ncbi:L,D-transpeptidase [Rhizorhabdus wittichii DC-6]|nr:L,D-transpeptidase [Rhizorhabdus wittichii DC-6]